MNERIRCPNPVCPQPDDVQQASVVVQTRYSLFHVRAAWQLLPPDAPVKRAIPVWALVVLVLLCLFPFGGPAVVTIPLSVIVGRVHLTPDLASRLAPDFFFGLLGVGLLVYYVADWRRKSAQYEIQAEQYRRARATWEELYYCNSCGSVFNPTESGRFVPAFQMKTLLT